MLKKLLKTLLCCSILISGLVIGKINVKAENDYSDYFNYPTIEYLNNLETMKERYEACNISFETLSQLTDSQLIKAIEDYPYLLDIYMFSTLEAGYKVLRERFNGIIELENRNIEYTNDMSIAMQNLMSLRKETSISLLSIAPDDLGGGGSGSVTAVYTPNGYAVTVYIHNTELTSAEINELDNYVRNNYPNAVLLRSATRKYNCHSYAWYSTSSNNNYWMNDPKAYMQYGAYTQRTSTSSISNLDKVFYNNGSLADNHSGIVYSSGSLDNIYIVSKWGKAGLVRHKIKYSPYNVNSNYGNISFWY